MNSLLIIEKTFKSINFSETVLKTADYEDCTFENCNFSNINLSSFSFTDCEFINCDLSMAKVKNTTFKEVLFKDCKILGILFNECNDFLLSFKFEHCNLSYSSFFKLKLTNQLFNNCKLDKVDFSFSNLQNAIFNECDLVNAVFYNTILEKTDFRTSIHYSLDPENNRIKNAKFSLIGIVGLLDKYNLDIEM